MRVAILSFIFFTVTHCHNGVPVVIWGNSGTQLSRALAGHGTSRSELIKNYLQPLTNGQAHNMVAFLQDKLSIEDITEHGDAYNANTDGGHYQHLKHQLDEHSSVSLPSVDSPADALRTLAKTFPGKVHELHAPYDLRSLQLDPKGSNLIMAQLPKSGDSSAVKTIDGILGSVSSAVKSLGQSFTAVYTGEKASQILPAAYTGRHLLQADATDAQNLNYTFINSTCVYLYSAQVRFQLKNTTTQQEAWILPNINTYDETKSSCANKTATLAWSYEDASLPAGLTNFSVLALFEFDLYGYWRMTTLNVTFDSNVTAADNVALVSENVWAPRYYSYHCTNGGGMPEVKPEYGANLHLNEFQVQFMIKPGVAEFGPPNDCVGFFTIPILMGLFVSFILIMILTFGITMISQINTMDRFDDPKGKTISVTVAE